MKSKVILLATLVILGITSLKAQLNVGSTSAPNADAMLQVTSSSKGILFPLVALTTTTSPAPLTANVAGMIVYNTATAGDVYPGPYFNDGTKWIFFGSKGDAILSALTTSAAAYSSAAADTWIQISSTEWTTLQTSVSGTTISGTASTPLTQANFPSGGFANYTVLNTTNPAPANSYLFAAAFLANNTSTQAVPPKIGNTDGTNIRDLTTGTFPSITGVAHQVFYFVRKAPASTVGSLATIVGAYFAPLNVDFARSIPNGSYLIGGNANGTGSGYSGAFGIQYLGTTTKQW